MGLSHRPEKRIMTKSSKTQATQVQNTRTVGALRAHLTRAANALEQTKDRAERREIRARMAVLEARIAA